METLYYKCQYCHQDYIPRKRRVQKFCSNSCRVSSHRYLNKSKTNQLSKNLSNSSLDKTKIDKMSLAGVGNAMLGSVASDLLQSVFTREENKPATQGQMNQLLKKIERYQEIRNLSNNELGQKPYYDNQLRILVYM